MFRPHPDILFGQTALCAPRTVDGLPVLAHDEATLIDRMSITWGREDHWDQPEPATIRFTFFDPTTDWALKIGTNNAIGLGVHVSIRLPDGHGIAEAPTGTYVIFQGFTTKVEAERRRVNTTAGKRTGWVVTVTAGDRTSALGNVPFTFENWPPERMIDRAIRLRDRAAGVGIRQFYFDADHVNGTVSALEVRDLTGLDVAQQLYTSFGHQWTYHPNRNVVNRIPEHRFPDSPHLVDTGDGKVIPRMPDLADWTGAEEPIDRAVHVGTAVDGCTVESDAHLSTDQLSYITRVECKWQNRHDANRTILTYQTKLFAVAPFRTLKYDSWFDDGITVDPVLQRTADKAFYQESGPHHPAITYRTKPFGGFTDAKHAVWFLTPAERRGYAFLSGSPWIADLGGVPPIVTPCGGTITYAAGEWTVTTRLLRGHRTTIGTGLTWAVVDGSLTWDAPAPARRFADPVTWGDTWFIRDPAIRTA